MEGPDRRESQLVDRWLKHQRAMRNGFAIHGTNDISRPEGPASHGCVRLHPANAATLLALVACNGARNTTIEISNERFAPANLFFLTAR